MAGSRRHARGTQRKRVDDDPLVARVTRYLVLHREARRLSADWRRALDALERQGFERYPSYAYDGRSFPVLDGDLSALAEHFEAALAQAPDAAAAIRRERDTHLRAAERTWRAWRRAARALGVEAASKRNDEAWAKLDALDLEALWASTPRAFSGAMALLRLVHDSGWLGDGHPDDTAAPRRALRQAITVLEALSAPSSPSADTAEPRPRRRAP